MEKSKSTQYLINLSFILVLIVDWFYMYVVQAQKDIIINAWFVIFPMITFFYCAFAFIAFLGLLYCKRQGFMLAFAVVLFGLLGASISYFYAFAGHSFLRQIFLVIIIINCCEMLFMAKNAKRYRNE